MRFTLKGRSPDLLVIFFTGIAVTILGMITPDATSIIVDNAIPDSDKGLLLQIGLGLLVAALGTGLFQLTQGFALLRIETAGDASTQAGVWNRLLCLPVSFFRQYTTGDIYSRVSSVSTISRRLSGRTLINLLTSLFALFYLGQLFYYNYKLALIAVAFAIIAIAYRLSTIRNAHRIYVLQAGRVVQQGTFQELAAVEGLFAQLMARQMA